MKKILNGQVETKAAFAVVIFIYVMALLAILLNGCKSSEILAAQKASRAERERQEQIAILEKTRELFPCDTFRTYSIDTILEFVLGDTVRIGEVSYVHDTAFIKRIVTKFVLDSAWLQQYRDSLVSANYAFDIARQDAAAQSKRADKAEISAKAAKENEGYYKRIVIIGGVVLGLLIGGIGALKIF